jgi:UDPglucose 6-dehydrogenase
MKIAVIGTGYVGLVAGACFAHSGNNVTCVDIDVKKVEGLRRGEIPIFEPGLDELVLNNVAHGRLHFTSVPAEAIADAQAIFIAVGTPPQEDGSADLSRVLQVAKTIADSLTGYAVVVTKSTVPIGTNAKVFDILNAHAKVPFDVASNPEFLKEGAALDDFLKPDRVVIGTSTDKARAVLHELYLPFVESSEQILFMDIRSAEMTKYAANAMLATRISFMNEVANLCEKVGADVTEVKRGIGTDSRIGMAFLNAGIGYGGSCFPKDVKALMMTGRQNGFAMEILSAVESVNDQQKSVLARKVTDAFGTHLPGKRIALLGLAFKPDTDDMREAPALVIARTLTQEGARLVGYDPVATETARVELGDMIEYASSWQEAVKGADAILLVTEWRELRGLAPQELAAATDCRLVFDGRNALDPQAMRAAGFSYHAMGRP